MYVLILFKNYKLNDTSCFGYYYLIILTKKVYRILEGVLSPFN